MPGRGGTTAGRVRARTIGVAGCAAILYLLVIWSSSGTQDLPANDEGVAIQFPTRALFALVGVFVAMAAALLLVMVVWAVKAGGERKPRKKKKRKWYDYLILLAILGVAMLALSNFSEVTNRLTNSFAQSDDPTTTTTSGLDGGPTGQSTAVSWLVVGGVAIAAGLVVFLNSRRTKAVVVSDDNDVVLDVPVVSDPSELSGLEPRSAVIGAAVLLESRLADVGQTRGSSETPEEYAARIRRWLGDRSTPAATVFRNALYARFSDHPVDVDMRTATLGALDQALAELRPFAGMR